MKCCMQTLYKYKFTQRASVRKYMLNMLNRNNAHQKLCVINYSFSAVVSAYNSSWNEIARERFAAPASVRTVGGLGSFELQIPDEDFQSLCT